MPRKNWTGFYLVWAVAFTICAALILAPDRQARSSRQPHRRRPRASQRSRRAVRLGSNTRRTGRSGSNTRSHIYHYPGQRWYGHTQEGKYLKEEDAIAEADRATQNGQ